MFNSPTIQQLIQWPIKILSEIHVGVVVKN